jgi:hypothetical protein
MDMWLAAYTYAGLVFLMLCGHALADRPLQSPEMSKGKRRTSGEGWWQHLAVHGLIHGGVVAVVTGLWWLGAAEALAHATIDDCKCTGRFGTDARRALLIDQALHVVCKLCWAAVAMGVLQWT